MICARLLWVHRSRLKACAESGHPQLQDACLRRLDKVSQQGLSFSHLRASSALPTLGTTHGNEVSPAMLAR